MHDDYVSLCRECDEPLDVDGDDGACYYTGGACPPGGCDCGASRTLYCSKCLILIDMFEKRQKDPHAYLPIHLATIPRDGTCLIDRWWVTTPDDCIIFWKGQSAQCSTELKLVEHIRSKLWPEYSLTQIPIVYLGFQDPDGKYTNLVPSSIKDEEV